MSLRDELIEVTARAIYEISPARDDAPWGQASGADLRVVTDYATAALDAILARLKASELAYRDDGQVVHELRGAPNDIWQTLLSTLEPKT